MQGILYDEYFHNPNISRTAEEIYAELDQFTFEVNAAQTHLHSSIDAWLVVPPLHYNNVFVKGLLISPSMELLLQKMPTLKSLFITAATPRSSAIPWSTSADIVFHTYENPDRVASLLRRQPHRAHQLFLPFEHEFHGYISEYHFAPDWAYVERDIDVVIVSRFNPVKNLPLLAEAVKIYAEKYNRPDFKVKLIAGQDLSENGKNLSREEFIEYEKVKKIQQQLPLGMLEIIPKVEYGKPLSELISHAKISAVGSLSEGACRTIRESNFSNTPVSVFQQFNQYTRGKTPVFPEQCGSLVPTFSAESVADTWHDMFKNYGRFSPRETILKTQGRKNYYDSLLKQTPYYQKMIPNLMDNKVINNVWLDLAIQGNYQMSFHQYIYQEHNEKNSARGLGHIEKLAAYYFDLFDLPFESLPLEAIIDKQQRLHAGGSAIRQGRRQQLIGSRKRPVIQHSR